ncbi:transposase [Salinisphaera sp. Q1T1-3]|uniref:transposase n=1 Tax=Salinisphaera sp. Q1T1-3 TaxID=2321229 RepID=UPI000E77154D|nr:hypothetical protein D3260_10520 [Salinisphaera sp. Q1T1-3]
MSITWAIDVLKFAGLRGRESGFYPASMEPEPGSDRARRLALAEMYASGVSTRRVARVTEQLCGLEVSSNQVSHCATALDEAPAARRRRPVVPLGACYEKRPHGGTVLAGVMLAGHGRRYRRQA